MPTFVSVILNLMYFLLMFCPLRVQGFSLLWLARSDNVVMRRCLNRVVMCCRHRDSLGAVDIFNIDVNLRVVKHCVPPPLLPLIVEMHLPPVSTRQEVKEQMQVEVVPESFLCTQLLCPRSPKHHWF